MPFQVRVRDFQSIGDASIEVDGLTVITGPNNSGKTALIRAIYGAFVNAKGTSFVRQGKDSTKVELSFADGRTMTWEKGPKVNRYELDGKALNRVGSGAPAETQALGVIPIEASGRELWPQFAHQFVGQIFLLNEPGSVLAEAIANVDKVGVLNESLRLSQSDRRSAASDLKLRLGDVAKQEEALLRFDGLDLAVEKVREVEARRKELSKDKKALDEFLGLRGRWTTSQKAVSDLLPVRAIPMVSSELTTRLKKTDMALEWAIGISKRLSHAKTERDVAERAKEAASSSRAFPDPKSVLEARTRLEEARALATRLKAAVEAVDTLTSRISNLHKDHAVSEGAVRSLFNESGLCPFCGVTHATPTC